MQLGAGKDGFINCCGLSSRWNLTGLEAKHCFPIPVPADDHVHAGREDCMNFVRTVTGPRIDCKPGPAEQVCPLFHDGADHIYHDMNIFCQVNQITAWLDLSSVYGSDLAVAHELRSHQGGLLKVSGPGNLRPDAGVKLQE